RFRLPGVDAAVLCGTHEVWEDRDAKAGRRITLHVAVIPARLRAKDPDPIVVLAGGAGQGAIALAPQVMPLFSLLNASRDVVLPGVAPAGMKLPLSFVADGGAALERLFEACAAEALCRRTYPDLRETIAKLRGQLARLPARVAIHDPRTGERQAITVNENVFL